MKDSSVDREQTAALAPGFRLSISRIGQAITGLTLLGILLSPQASADSAMRCPGGVVSRGMESAEVETRCGEPAMRSEWRAPFSGVADEVWTYDFGPRALLRLLQFRERRLSAIDTDGYGFSPRGNGRCRPQDIRPGWSAYRLVVECGEPERIEVLGALLAPPPGPFVGSRVPPAWTEVYRERWRYNFGSRFLRRELTLDDGRVTEIVTLGRGG